MKKLILAVAILFAFAAPVLAVPSLQLDIEGGTYDWADESVMTAEGNFTLYALFTPGHKGGGSLSEEYNISIAVYPQTGPSDVSLGTFTLDGPSGFREIDVTEDMTYGTAPLETILALQGWDSGDLPKHGVFPTYFYEYSFFFDPTLKTTTYNTQDDPGGTEGGLDPNANGGTYYMPFQVADAFLTGDYTLHFDLYSTKIKCNGDVDRDNFAPFSHDAGTTRVPEPGSLLLLGIGLVGIAGLRKKFA